MKGQIMSKGKLSNKELAAISGLALLGATTLAQGVTGAAGLISEMKENGVVRKVNADENDNENQEENSTENTQDQDPHLERKDSSTTQLSVGEKELYYDTFTEALNAAEASASAATLTILANANDATSANTWIKGQHDITINTDGHTLSSNVHFDIYDGAVRVTGGGKLVFNSDTPVWVNVVKDGTPSFIIDTDTTVETGSDVENAIIMYQDHVGDHNGYKGEITVNGTLRMTGESRDYKDADNKDQHFGPAGIWVMGNIYNTAENGDISGMKVTVGENGIVDVVKGDVGIAIQGAATAEIAGTVTAGDEAVEQRNGTLTIKETARLSSTTSPAEAVGNNNGTTTSGAALAVASYGHGPITLTIEGGAFSGYTPIYESNPNKISSDNLIVNMAIKGGTYTGLEKSDTSIYSGNVKNFVSGGTYDYKLDENYIAEGYTQVETSDNKYEVIQVTNSYDTYQDAAAAIINTAGEVHMALEAESLSEHADVSNAWIAAINQLNSLHNADDVTKLRSLAGIYRTKAKYHFSTLDNYTNKNADLVNKFFVIADIMDDNRTENAKLENNTTAIESSTVGAEYEAANTIYGTIIKDFVDGKGGDIDADDYTEYIRAAEGVLLNAQVSDYLESNYYKNSVTNKYYTNYQTAAAGIINTAGAIQNALHVDGDKEPTVLKGLWRKAINQLDNLKSATDVDNLVVRANEYRYLAEAYNVDVEGENKSENYDTVVEFFDYADVMDDYRPQFQDNQTTFTSEYFDDEVAIATAYKYANDNVYGAIVTKMVNGQGSSVGAKDYNEYINRVKEILAATAVSYDSLSAAITALSDESVPETLVAKVTNDGGLDDQALVLKSGSYYDVTLNTESSMSGALVLMNDLIDTNTNQATSTTIYFGSDETDSVYAIKDNSSYELAIELATDSKTAMPSVLEAIELFNHVDKTIGLNNADIVSISKDHEEIILNDTEKTIVVKVKTLPTFNEAEKVFEDYQLTSLNYTKVTVNESDTGETLEQYVTFQSNPDILVMAFMPNASLADAIEDFETLENDAVKKHVLIYSNDRSSVNQLTFTITGIEDEGTSEVITHVGVETSENDGLTLDDLISALPDNLDGRLIDASHTWTLDGKQVASSLSLESGSTVNYEMHWNDEDDENKTLANAVALYNTLSDESKAKVNIVFTESGDDAESYNISASDDGLITITDVTESTEDKDIGDAFASFLKIGDKLGTDVQKEVQIVDEDGAYTIVLMPYDCDGNTYCSNFLNDNVMVVVKADSTDLALKQLSKIKSKNTSGVEFIFMVQTDSVETVADAGFSLISHAYAATSNYYGVYVSGNLNQYLVVNQVTSEVDSLLSTYGVTEIVAVTGEIETNQETGNATIVNVMSLADNADEAKTIVAAFHNLVSTSNAILFGLDFEISNDESGNTESVAINGTKDALAALVAGTTGTFKGYVYNMETSEKTEYTIVDGQIKIEESHSSGTPAGTSDKNDRHASGNNVPNDAKPQGCSDTVAAGTPDVFQINRKGTEATIYFAPIPGANSYHVVFGHQEGDERYGGISMSANDVSGVLAIDIENLEPSQQYSFKIAPVNGCAVGTWSNWLTAKGVARYGKTPVKTYRYTGK